MTNNWADIGNTTLVMVMGANPVENHPACIAHINRARFPKDYFASTDPRSNKKPADLIVVDPRKTRTALQVDPNRPGDRYVRIRPGTDIAFVNGVIRAIIAEMETRLAGDPVRDKFYAFLNQGANPAAATIPAWSRQSFFPNKSTGGSGFGAPISGAVDGGSKYTDARFIIRGDGNDYDREDVGLTGAALVGGETPAQIIYGFPKKAATVLGDPNTVYNRLKAHVDPYTQATVADICGCTTADVRFVADAYIANSRCSSGATPDPDGNWPGNGPTGVGTAGEDPRNASYRATTMLYAMGLTQHTCGGQNVKSFAVLQTLMGNLGRAGGGINALRGIHNVQGSTDMGVLYHLIPAYSGNPSTQVTAIPDTTTNAFGKYMDNLWGLPLSGTGTRTDMNGSYDDAYYTARGALQQAGFLNMTRFWFGPTADGTTPHIADGDRTKIDAAYSLWPKGNGDNHVLMFRKMASGDTKAAVVWGQNPAVTEPNQSKIREGFYNLDLLVVTDLFETETAGVDRKPAGVTFLLPSCSHVEKAGSSANSGRVLQWRYQSTLPRGASKDDTHLLLMLAKALDVNVVGGSAFSHIKAVWDTGAYGFTYTGSVYDNLFGRQYGWDGASDFNAVSLVGDYVAPLGTTVDAAPGIDTGKTLTGSEAVAEYMYQQMSRATGGAGTPGTGCIWIYTNGYSTGKTTNKHAGQSDWAVSNRAKSRSRWDGNGTFAFPGWGYSWLVNRRVLYNQGEIPGDINDWFMSAESQSRMFNAVAGSAPALLNYSRWYRTYHMLSDTPRGDDNLVPAIHKQGPGGAESSRRFPGHTEPYESPREDLVATWGKNASATGALGTGTANTYENLLMSGTAKGAVASFPLVLTTIRCVEHFQGGPITRNNWWNVEQEPEPWVEINSADALLYGINDGDMVNVTTARSNSTSNQEGRTVGAAGFAKGFRARVGGGLQANQRVGRGVVAIPWHWGDRGLSAGSRANDLCIDAGDANTYIPEYKACLCKIEKL
ncbi:MAG: molybdopterin-dependent oxidoreductase [Coriobacteriia bacterium]|nr:molybdopterin-dependent oxidoreductase [Coriobacteriia bacterium]